VRAEFACSVIDAARVVEDGRQIRSSLLAYLNACPRIHDIGQQHGIDELLEVQEQVQAQIRAYTEIQPPAYPGMLVRVVGTDVLTPAILKEQEHSRRATERAHEEELARRERELRISQIEQRNSHLLRTDKLGRDHEFETLTKDYARDRRRGEHKDEVDARLHAHDLQDLDQQGELGRRRRANTFAREEDEQDAAVVGESLSRQAWLSYQRGEIGEGELSERLDRLDERGHGRALQGRALDREDERWQVEREDARQEAVRREKLAEAERLRLEARAQTEERRAAAAHEREQQRWTVERADHRADQRYQAEQQERLAEINRRYEAQQKSLQMRFELRRAAILKGYGDSSVEDLERFVDGLEDYARQEEASPAASAAMRPALDEAPAPEVRLTKDGEDGPGQDDDDDGLAGELWKHEV
jgi:hypothetical protein